MENTINKTVLLVEDEKVTAGFVSTLLKNHGYKTVVAASGLEAVAFALSDESINLVLMDIELGEGIDGAEAAALILEQRMLPVVFLTSHAGNEYAERVNGILRYGYVLKNSGDSLLLSTIEMAYRLYDSQIRMQESEEKYRLVFNFSPLGLVHYNSDGVINTCNDVFVGIIGSSHNALIGLDMLKLPDAELKEAVRMSLKGFPGHYEGIYHSVTAEKATPVRIVFAPLRASDGHVIGGVGVIEDVTERQTALDLLKKTNEELESANEELLAANEEFEAINEELISSNMEINQREEEIRLIIENSPISIQIVDREGYTVRVNKSHTRLFGAVPPPGYSVFTDPLLQHQGLIELMDRIRGGEVVYFPEFYYNAHDLEKSFPDNPIWIRMIGYSLKNQEGKPVSYVLMHEDATEKKRATLELLHEKERTEERERNYREIFNSSNDAIFLMDRETGAVIDVNETMLKMFGYKDKDEVINGSIEKLSAAHDEFFEYKLKELMEKIIESDYKTFEWKSKRKNGEEFQVEVTMKCIIINGISRIMATARDITIRKRFEEEIQVNEEIFRLFMENSPIYIFFKDSSIRSLRLSRNYEQMLGRPLSELLGKTMDELFPSDLAKQMIADDIKILNEGKLINVEEEFGGRYFNTIKYPIWQNGKPAYLAGYTIDITERKFADEKLTSEKERLSVTLRSIGDGVITTDINGSVELLNRIAEELTGWSQEEAKGKPVSEIFNIVSESTRETSVSPVLKALESGIFEESINHTVLISRTGIERLISLNGSPIKDKNSSTVGAVMVFRDITEKRKFEETVQNAQKLESLGVLAGGIAHDFNNILGGIFGCIDLARMKNKDSKLNNYFNGALSAIDRARGLTQQLLTFSRGGTPVMKAEKLSPFIQDTVLFALSGSNVSCKFFIPGELPDCYFDKNQIGQVIDNLIINALQSMPMGGVIDVSAEVSVLGEKEHGMLHQGRYVKISIKDRGVGIPKELIPFIFDPFFSTKTKGHGLGLATCYSIINRHGGAIEVESTPGEGSVFHVYIPVSAENAEIEPEKNIIRHFGYGRILIMDDEEIILNILGEMLTEFGYSVESVRDGREAVNFFNEEKKAGRNFTALIFDLTVPGGFGGIDAVKEIRRADPDIPVFVSSGYSEDTVMANPQDYGFTASIRKPFKLSELSEMLEKNIRMRGVQ